MPAPAIFGVEGRERGIDWDWQFGPLLAVVRYTFERPNAWIGIWILTRGAAPELHRTDPGTIEQVTQWLESWLRVHVAELVGALGLALVERKLARDVEECDREFRETRNRIRRGRREPRGSKGFRP